MKTLRSTLLVVLTLGLGLSTQPQRGPSPKDLLTIPADITSYGGVFLRAQINNSQPLWFALDSGASFPFVIDASQASILGLKLDRRALRGMGAGPSPYDVADTNLRVIAIGGLRYTNQTVAVLSLDSIAAQIGRPLDGIVGIDLFTRYVVEIGYPDDQIKLYDPKTYKYSGAGEIIPLTLRDSHFFVPAEIVMPDRLPLNGQFLVDTGGWMVGVVLTTPFARSNRLPASRQPTIMDRSLSGLGGETKLLVGRATSFTVGKLRIREPVVYVSQDSGGALASSDYAGVIGSEILRKFSVIFDYTRRRLILEPNARYTEQLEYDMSGMSLRAYGEGLKTLRVYQVLDNSPASEAGLRVGDEVSSINGESASKFTLEKVLQMMKQPGREYKLLIKTASRTRLVMIKTRRLI